MFPPPPPATAPAPAPQVAKGTNTPVATAMTLDGLNLHTLEPGAEGILKRQAELQASEVRGRGGHLRLWAGRFFQRQSTDMS